LNLGTPNSGVEVYPCTSKQAEVNELWSLDIHTYKWIQLNTTKMNGTVPPDAREVHTATVMGGNIYVFGGKSRAFSVDNVTLAPIFDYHEDAIFGDFWRLNVPQIVAMSMNWPITSQTADSPLYLEPSRRSFVTLDGTSELGVNTFNGDGEDARSGRCIDKVVVTAVVTHPCINQLRISIMGPGRLTGSPNFHSPSAAHEVLLYNQQRTNGTGCSGGTHTFIFDDDADKYTDDCCQDGFEGEYIPEGRLSEYIGTSPISQWTLVLQDNNVNDNLNGYLTSWSLDFTTSECSKVYSWTNLTATISNDFANAPSPRHSHKALTYDDSLFIFGGRDSNDQPIYNDLYRYDIDTSVWTKLTAVDFNTALDTSSSYGSSFLLTTWGLLRYGGYLRQPHMGASYDNYVPDVYLMDPVTMRWRHVPVDGWRQSDGTGMNAPYSRYLAAMAFLPSGATHFRVKSFSYRQLYDQPMKSNRANYQSAVSDSLIMFGGHNGASGGIFDGSTGGLLDDLWTLRLANFSTSGTRYDQNEYVAKHCAWRSVTGPAWGLATCKTGQSGDTCQFRDLLMLAWCSNTNQTMM
jgi:hypothetical protein